MREFKGRVDGWFYIVMAASCLLVLWVCGMLLQEGELVAALIDALVLAMVLLLWLPICLRNYLLLDSEGLLIVFGLIKKRIGWGDVRRVALTSNPLSSLAASMRRVEIRYGRSGVVMVAPADREGFLDAVAELAPWVEIKR